MKENKGQLKSYIMKTFIVFSVAMMLVTNVLDTALARTIEMLQAHYHLLEDDPLGAIQPGAKYLVIMAIAVFILLQLFVLCTGVNLFGRKINAKVTVPIDKLVTGLDQITQGALDTRLTFQAENELVKIRDSFNQMASEMEESQAAKKAYEAERSLLFSNIAHDLKTPITTIAGYSKLLAEGMVTSETKQIEYLSAIHAKSQQMNEMLDLLFCYAKLDTDQYVMNYKNTDIIELVRVSIAMFYADFEHNGISLEIDIPVEAVVINIDGLEMSRVIANLLSNVIKHNPRGSHALVRVEKTDRLRLIIADNGNEIPENIVARLFDPFVLGDESRSSRGGSGLGLAITKKIIEKHGGEIYLDTAYQDFTKAFIIHLKAT